MNKIASKKKIVIYSFDRPDWACARLRLLGPLTTISEQYEAVMGVRFDGDECLVDTELVDEADIIILQRFFPCEATVLILDRIFNSGKPVIYETDDLLTEIPATNPTRNEKNNKDIILGAIRKSDLVTVSTAALKEKYKIYNSRIIVIPNMIDAGIWQRDDSPHNESKIVVGYCGTTTHVDDLAIIEPALIQISKIYKERIKFLFMGCITDNLKQLPNVEFVEFEAGYYNYINMLKTHHIDIALAPLRDNEFNRCKSNIKWIEYSILGIPAVFSDIEPYRGTIQDTYTGKLAKNTTSSWFDAIYLLIESDLLRKSIAENAVKHVLDHYTLQNNQDVYRPVLDALYHYRDSIRIDENVNDMDAKVKSDASNRNENESNNIQGILNIEKQYSLWRHSHSLSEIDAQLYAERMMTVWKSKPGFHVVCVLEQGEESQLSETISSLYKQLYKNWHLTILTRESSSLPVAGLGKNIDIVIIDNGYTDVLQKTIRERNLDWVVFSDIGTQFEPHALISFADYINAKPHWSVIYSDHDRISEDNEFTNPCFKPDINHDYLLSMDYVDNTIIFKTSTFIETGGFQPYTHYENYDLLLRVITQAGEDCIGHVHDVLMHLPEKVHRSTDIAKKIVIAFLKANNLDAEVTDGYDSGTFRVVYKHKTDEPKVSIIIPTRDMMEYTRPCVDSILEKTTYQNYEIIIVDNQSEDKDIIEYFEQLEINHPGKVRVLKYPHEFNFSAICNYAADNTDAEYLLELNNDTQVLTGDWLSRMMHHAQRPDVGIVGARLLYPGEGMIQHAGVILGLDEIAGHPYIGTIDFNNPGYMHRAHVDQNLSAVTGACMLVRKSLYDTVGGMDEEQLKVSFNDIDLCLKIRDAGYKIVWTPYATLLHHGSVSQIESQGEIERKLKRISGFRQEKDTMVERWSNVIVNDPAYNKNLSISSTNYEIEYTFVNRIDAPVKDRPRIIGIPVYGGSGEYRVRAPLNVISRHAVAQTAYTESFDMKIQRILTFSEINRIEADTVLVQNFIVDQTLDALEKYKKYCKADIIYSLDDLITDLPKQNAFKKHIPVNARTRLRKALKLCDRLIVTSEPLHELCKHMLDDIRVIPNYLERQVWGGLQSQRGTGTKPRVGWAGAQQHDGDLAFIEEVVAKTADEVDWVFFGMCPANIRKNVREVHEYESSFEKYAVKLSKLNLDLAIAPLEIHPFNEAKSNLRILEYGIMGWPVICTDIYPYQGAPVKRVQNNVDDWVNAIRERIYDLDAAYKEGDYLRNWVRNNYMLEDHLDLWLSALLSEEHDTLIKSQVN